MTPSHSERITNSSTRTRSRAQRATRARSSPTFWLFVGPLVLGLLVFTYLPIGWALYLSVHRASYTVTPTEFVGFANYIQMLQDRTFQQSLLTFAAFAAIIVPTTFVLALFLALIVNSAPRFRGVFRSVYFLPTACSYVVASLIWRSSMFTGLPSGAANSLVTALGMDPIAWIRSSDPPWYWFVVVSLRLWIGLGFNMLLFLAALQDIPKTLYEAAVVDGADRGWATFRHITFPLIRNTSILVILLNIIAAFQAFDEFYNVLGAGSAGGVVIPPLVYLFRIGFAQADYGMGSAGAFILTAIIIGVTIIQGRLTGFGRSEE